MSIVELEDSEDTSPCLNGGHWRPHSCNDFQAETSGLSPFEYTAYSRLLDRAWPLGGSLPLDEEELRRMATLSKSEWKRARARVLAFFEKRADGYHNVRLDEELVKADRKIKAARQNGEASAAVRKKRLPDSQSSEINRNSVNERSSPVATDEEQRFNSSPSPLPSKEERTIASQSAPAGARAVAKLPVRDELWQSGLKLIRDATGKSDDAARSMLGKFVREAKDDCGLVLAVLREAADLRPINYMPWVNEAIKVRLKPPDRDGFLVLAQRRAAGGMDMPMNPVLALLAGENAPN
jgi:uncharacterized protein YdaU (DUF1376 family)